MLKRGTDQSHELNCKQVNALLGAYLEGGLPAEQADAVEAHLDTCLDCRRAASLDAEVASRLQMEAAWQRRRLSPRAAARIQQRLYGRMRRSMMAQRVSRLAWGVVGMALLALVVFGGYAWWQQRFVAQDATPEIADTPVLPTETARPTSTVGPTNTPRPTTDSGQPATATPLVPTVTPAAGDGAITIRFACLDQRRAEFESLAADFYAQNPSIRIEIVTVEQLVGDDFENSIEKLVTGADTAYYLVDLDAVPQGLLRDLTPFIDADPTFAPEDFFPGMLEAFDALGGIWALPSQARLNLLFFDKQIFEQAGVPYPALDWTQESFLTVAQQLTRRDGGDVTQYGFVDYVSRLSDALVVPLIGNILDDQPPLDSRMVADDVQWYTDLALRHGVMPKSLWDQESIDRIQDLIRTGRVAMWSYSYSLAMQETYRRESREVGIAPFPGDDEPLVTAFMYGYMMSAGTRHPQESWRWLHFLSRQRLLGRTDADSLPARRSVAEQSGYWERFDEETARVLRYAAEHLFLTAATSEKRFQLDMAIQAVFEGKPVEEALADAQAAFEEYLVQVAQATPMPVVVATPRPEGSPGAVTIAFAPPPGGAVTTYRTLADAFNQAQTEVEVQIVSAGQAQAADCFAGAGPVAEPGTRTTLLNLQPLLEADSDFSLADFHSRFLDAFRYQGDLWGLPTQAQVRVLFYNRDLFDAAAGEPYPAAGWTLDDFFARAVALTTGDGADKQYGFLPLNGDASDLPAFVALQGAALWDQEGRPRFDAPEVVAAVRWYTDLALKHGVMPAFPDDVPDPDPAAQQARQALVRAGRVAMWTDFSGLDRSSVWPLDAEVGMAPLPRGAEEITDFLYEGLFIGADAPYPEACWQWLKFVSERAEPVGQLPARRSLLDSDIFAQEVGDEAVETYRALLEYDDLYRPTAVETGSQIQWLYQAVADIWAGARPEAALAEAQREATR
jgi:ABC-type glycerol-3-phosphate transport system substrate-binding protein